MPRSARPAAPWSARWLGVVVGFAVLAHMVGDLALLLLAATAIYLTIRTYRPAPPGTWTIPSAPTWFWWWMTIVATQPARNPHVAVFVAALTWPLVAYSPAARARRDAQSFQQWQQFLGCQTVGTQTIRVRSVYQRARTGCKLSHSPMDSDVSIDTWLPIDVAPAPSGGDLLVVRGQVGYGPHNHNPRTFYVSAVHARVPRHVREGARRHLERSRRTT